MVHSGRKQAVLRQSPIPADAQETSPGGRKLLTEITQLDPE